MDEQPVSDNELRSAFARSGLESLGWTFQAAMENAALAAALACTAWAARRAEESSTDGPRPVQMSLI